MASGRGQKPYDESKLQQLEESTFCGKSSTSGIRYNAGYSSHEHTLGDRVKDMASSARKLLHHHDHHAPDHAHSHKPCCNCSSGAKAKTETKKKKNDKIVKNHEGHERNCMTKMMDHVKNLKKKDKN